MKKSSFFAIVMIGFSFSSFAQAGASATGTATIIEPITITNAGDLNFGNIAVVGAGTVELVPFDDSRIPLGGVTLPAIATGTVTAAHFDVTGDGTSTYAITLPSTDYIITRLTGSETMTVNVFKSFPTVAAGGVLTAGAQTFSVGATLNVGAAQVAGTYTNATGFDVSVNYN